GGHHGPHGALRGGQQPLGARTRDAGEGQGVGGDGGHGDLGAVGRWCRSSDPTSVAHATFPLARRPVRRLSAAPFAAPAPSRNDLVDIVPLRSFRPTPASTRSHAPPAPSPPPPCAPARGAARG